LGICLTTPGGEAEVVEKLVEITRYHYPKEVDFIIPSAAFSAGTIFCMSGDRIFMDYSSSLGPIDPQVPDREDKYLVPALGYLDKVEEVMSSADYINQIANAPEEPGVSQDNAYRDLLKDLDEVESTLREIGVTLEPRFFDISLVSRVGATSRR